MDIWIDNNLNGGVCRLRRQHTGFGHGANSEKEKSGCKHKMPKTKKNQLLVFFCVASGKFFVGENLIILIGSLRDLSRLEDFGGPRECRRDR